MSIYVDMVRKLNELRDSNEVQLKELDIQRDEIISRLNEVELKYKARDSYDMFLTMLLEDSRLNQFVEFRMSFYNENLSEREKQDMAHKFSDEMNAINNIGYTVTLLEGNKTVSISFLDIKQDDPCIIAISYYSGETHYTYRDTH